MKLQLLIITIMFLSTMATISSTSKDNMVVGNKNIQINEVMLHLQTNSNQHEKGFQYEQELLKKIQNKKSIYKGVFWHRNKNKWETKLKYNNKQYYGGYFSHEKHAGMKVNLLCDQFGQERQNPTIDISLESDTIQQFQNKTSKYHGVSWNNNDKKWQTELMHKKKKYYGGYFDNEEHAAMKVNILCDNCEIRRKNLTIDIDLHAIQKIQNTTSNYIGVSWLKDRKKWLATLTHNKMKYYGGYFDNEKYAAMNVNLLCDKYEIRRKNPTIDIESSAIQNLQNKTSIYNGVSWHKDKKKWYTELMHKKKKYYGGYFDNEEYAAMKVNILCDNCEIQRKNPTIDIDLHAIQKKPKLTTYQSNVVDKQVKVEEEKHILDVFKDEYEDRFMLSNDGKKCAPCQSKNIKRKRKEKLNYE